MNDCCKEGRESYDIAVIGAGSAGFSAAITAAEQDAQVALIGQGTLGGTCVNVGCVPSKTLIRAAEALHSPGRAERFAGIVGEARLTDWGQLLKQKEELVATLRQKKYQDLLSVYQGITYREGAAQITEDGVRVNGNVIRADRVIIATGASAVIPDIPGMQEIPYLTSTIGLELTELPRSLLVLGGGYIGCELAQLFARMGVQTTLAMRSRLLPEAEPEVSEALSGYLCEEGITVLNRISYRSIQAVKTGVTLRFMKEGQEDEVFAEQVLVATGRRPNSATLGLEKVGIKCDPGGGIQVDEYLGTTREGVYAAGDVTGKDQFVYMAAYGAKIAALNALNGNNRRYDNRTMPWVVFTDPQVAGVGLTEKAAQAQGFEVTRSVLSLNELPRALVARDTRGLIKLVADKATDQLLGAQLLAPEGADSIQTAALAIRYGITVQEFGEMLFPYLTTVEGLKLAAQIFNRDISQLSCCAG